MRWIIKALKWPIRRFYLWQLGRMCKRYLDEAVTPEHRKWREEYLDRLAKSCHEVDDAGQ